MKINIKLCSNGTCIIEMNNSIIKKGLIIKSVRYNKANDPMPCFIEVIQHFTKGREFFFGHYRTDGINLTGEEWEKYGKEIPEYFQANGRYDSLVMTVEKRGKTKEVGELIVGSAPVNDSIYEMLPKIFHYYLETIFFCPKIDWKTFAQEYRGYMKHGASDFISKGYTDFLFAYVDSGDFSISFNPNVYEVDSVCEEINRILS